MATHPSSSSSSPSYSTPNASSAAYSSAPPAFLQSPNAIPPRTSSSGLPSQQTVGSPPKPVLRPVPEGNWLSSSHAPHHASHTHAAAQIPPAAAQPASAAPGHARSRSRKASITSAARLSPSTSFMTVTMAHPPPPPPDPSRYATEDFNFSSKRTWTDEKEKVLTGPFQYLYAQPGKEIRSKFIQAFNAWLDVPAESLETITRVVGMLHTASLLVDDVEDSSILRRGIPVAHHIFGVPQTINSSNYVYFYALQELLKLKNPKVMTVFTEELLNLHRGQGMDLFWRDTLTCPTEDDYLEMVGNKTGGLFRLGIKLMQAESRSLIDCVPLVNLIGLIFQIRDDYQNLWSREYTDNKGMCEDLTEGKFSFPVIHSIRSDPTNMQLISILQQKTTSEEVKRYAVKYMDGTGSFAYTREVLAVLIDRARKLTDEIDEGRGQAAGIHRILDSMVIKEDA